MASQGQLIPLSSKTPVQVARAQLLGRLGLRGLKQAVTISVTLGLQHLSREQGLQNSDLIPTTLHPKQSVIFPFLPQ